MTEQVLELMYLVDKDNIYTNNKVITTGKIYLSLNAVLSA